MKEKKENTDLYIKKEEEYNLLEEQKKEKEDQINELLEKQEKYEKQIKNEILSNKALEKDISNSKSNYLYQTLSLQNEKQELVNKIEKLKYIQDFTSSSSAATIREYKDIL
jgi:formate dehydrogenase maturation protein FdhE